MQINNERIVKSILFLTFGLVYLFYLYFMISTNYGGVDYETFMSIGHSFRSGTPVWGENSFYPLPYVVIFSAFEALPHWLSIILWNGLPLVLVLIISDGDPLILLFAPLFAHFVGGQSAIVGVLGLWIYHRNQNKVIGGVGLAIMLIKPQLGIVALLWAVGQWMRKKDLRGQAAVTIILTACIYLPCFLIIPTWVSQWLAAPRGLFERAIVGVVPRTLLMTFGGGSLLFWMSLAAISIGLVVALRKHLNLDRFILLGFMLVPLLHDYDLIQLIPLLRDRRSRAIAALLCVPLWLVILFAYGDNSAWYAATIIAPGLLVASLGVTFPQRSRYQAAIPLADPDNIYYRN